MNWGERGYNVAMKGQTIASGQAYYARECTEKWGTAVNAVEFKTGYADGLKAFCTPDNALQFASQGGEYRGICPKEVESEFLPRYQTGQLIFLNRRVKELEDEMSSLRSQLSNREMEISNLQSQLSSSQSRVCN